MISRKRPKRKASGGIYQDGRKKQKSESAGVPTMSKLGAIKRKIVRVLGGNQKVRVLQTENVNLFDGTKYVQTKIKTVAESPANRNFVRRNILTKGTIIETEQGKAKITSRPGQTGSLNAVLVK